MRHHEKHGQATSGSPHAMPKNILQSGCDRFLAAFRVEAHAHQAHLAENQEFAQQQIKDEPNHMVERNNANDKEYCKFHSVHPPV